MNQKETSSLDVIIFSRHRLIALFEELIRLRSLINEQGIKVDSSHAATSALALVGVECTALRDALEALTLHCVIAYQGKTELFPKALRTAIAILDQ